MNKALVRGATKRQTFYDQHKTANYVLTVKRKYCRSYYPTDLEGQENSFCNSVLISQHSYCIHHFICCVALSSPPLFGWLMDSCGLRRCGGITSTCKWFSNRGICLDCLQPFKDPPLVQREHTKRSVPRGSMKVV